MKGFKKPVYIGLGLFVVGILAAGAVSNFVMKKTNELSRNVEGEVVETVESAVYKAPVAAKKQETAQPASNTVVIEEPAEEPFAFTAPVRGEILTQFSGNTLVFSETLQDYRRHGGVDIRTNNLEKVCAAESGVIKEVKNDALLGITIVIDHENGFESVYSNLSTADMVEEGDRVEKGVIISGVGDTALSETGEKPHLHFELYKDGKAVNPEEYITF